MTYSPLRSRFALFTGVLLTIASFTNTHAQGSARDWLAWQGCWHADGAPAAEVLCVVPDGAGIRMVTLEDGAVRAESRVIADNRSRTISQEGCRGSEVARWSADRRRVFLISQLTCEP